MVKIEETLYCDGCGVEILLSPIMVNGFEYCCQDCSQGLVCRCAEKMELDERRRASSGEDTTFQS
jgi:hypothetical protein